MQETHPALHMRTPSAPIVPHSITHTKNPGEALALLFSLPTPSNLPANPAYQTLQVILQLSLLSICVTVPLIHCLPTLDSHSGLRIISPFLLSLTPVSPPLTHQSHALKN